MRSMETMNEKHFDPKRMEAVIDKFEALLLRDLKINKDKEIHLEFMKAALIGILCHASRITTPSIAVNDALMTADAALLEYQKRWEGEK